ncbi:MAG: helix-turn-helix transcriptional regulator, partial [Lawsonibacter sp.]|nr:helix-turn-helix transcriptional regulator [Lawsonibacter sp.]
MTLGQRIAQKRKELGLSQEGLGDRLGVSRQAIYKWESDTSVPEIEKLISLSKLFSVPVGWLLGLEEETREEVPSSGELTETQLQMVQEIVDRYLAAQPKPAPPKRRRLARLCRVAGVLVLLAVLFNLFSKLDRVTQDYNSLRYSVDDVNRNVNSQISSITNRVEDILKSQNALTAEWSTELASTDLAAGTATFNLRAVPKTYVEGMTALFVARSGEDTVEIPIEPGEDHAFSGQVTCPLTDDISLTVVFLTGDKRETQWLEDYGYLYSGSFPELSLDGRLWFDMVHKKDNLLPASKAPGVQVENYSENGVHLPWGWRPEPPATVQVGLFQDQKLVMWYEEREEEI